MQNCIVRVAFIAMISLTAHSQVVADSVAIKVTDSGFDFVKRAGELDIYLDGQPFATYAWSDPKTTRPYFKQVKATGGTVQVTRNHPPQDGDFNDHETYHPGIWWGFGDVGGNDYWRMKAKIVGGTFVEEPTATRDEARFAVRNALKANSGDNTFCEQTCRYRILRRTYGILMICESEFVREHSDFWLGDQEEMGLAFRVATPLTAKHGGTIRDSEGRTALKQIRTNQSNWCNYSGPIAGKHGGLMLMNDPKNFRKPWWHAVDTGLLIANPLGESELNGRGKKKQNVLVKKGTPFRLRYGCLIHLHEKEAQFDPEKAYEDFVQLLSQEKNVSRRSSEILLEKEERPKVPDGFRVSVFASEPQVYKPTSMCFDAKGRLMVGQGPQYPRNLEDTPHDSVVILIDSDEDGVVDATKTFATGFNSVQGLAWKGNDLYVANAPELTIVRDLDGDDEADEYVVVYTDLGNREHALHGLNFGPDGKLYMTKGNSKGHNDPDKYGYVAPRAFRELWDVEHPIGAPDTYPTQTYTKHNYKKSYHHWDDDWGRHGGVLRCDPLGANLEIISRGMRNPWDMAMDGEFNFLGTDNDQDQGDRLFMPFYGAHFGWGHSYSNHWTGENHLPTAPISGPVFPGSGTGVIYYSHEHFPPKYRNVFFINDWLNGTYVYRPEWSGGLMQPRGGRWEPFAQRGAGNTLYRPTDMEFGPDGSIYVCGWGGDYHYDREKEGSWIFRIINSNNLPPTKKAWWSKKRERDYPDWTTEELLQDLGPDTLPVWRVNAQDELVNRAKRGGELPTDSQTWALWVTRRASSSEPEVAGRLASMAASNKTGPPKPLNTRIQALRMIGSLPETHVPADLLREALSDPEPRIRHEAVQAIWQAKYTNQVSDLLHCVAEEQDRITFYSGWQALRELLNVDERKRLLKDSRSQVRLAALLSLQEAHEITLAEVLSIAESDEDERIQNCAMTWAMNPSPPKKLPNSKSRIEFEESVTMSELIKRANESEKLRPMYLSMISRATYGDDEDDWEEVRDFYQSLGSDAERSLVLKPLSRENDSRPLIWDAMGGSSQLQQAAVRALVSQSARFGNSPEEIASFVLSRLAATKPSHVTPAVDVLYRLNLPQGWRPNGDWDLAFSHAFEKSADSRVQRKLLTLLLRIAPTGVVDGLRTKSQVESLSQNPSPTLYASLEKLNPLFGIGAKLVAPKQATIDGVLAKLSNADAGRGKELFFSAEANCAGCHRVSGQGNSFAPDLSSIGLRAQPRTVVQSILEPSATITEGYHEQTFVMDDGTTVSGAVLQESPNWLRIVTMEGVVENLDTKLVQARSKKELSAMPTGFGLLGDEQVADIAAYLVACRHGGAELR